MAAATGKDLTAAIATLQATLLATDAPVAKQMRACFLLKQCATHEAIDALYAGLQSSSALLKHEICYVLGQMKDVYAITHLTAALADVDQPPIVRHEAAEGLAAIGDAEVIPTLEKYSTDPAPEVSETCILALDSMRSKAEQPAAWKPSEVYHSMDPAPPAEEDDIAKLRDMLIDPSNSLFKRYRALFKLRDIGGDAAGLAVCEGFADESALFKHELAYVLGQMRESATIPALSAVLKDESEHEMVRHEAAEALGSIALDDVLPLLTEFQGDTNRVVRESCDVALDLAEYWTNGEVDEIEDLVSVDVV